MDDSRPIATSERYQAFLSYAHADERWAAWLHRALESYRLPASLKRDDGKGRDRLRPIFRDREELSAGHDLTESIRAALAESSALIVLCSPAAAASRWVNEEIHSFRQLHPERPILCAIVDGDPHPAEGSGQVSCLPPALFQRRDADGRLHDLPGEPLAADFRESGDGRQLAKVKLLAGLLDVRLDDLLQREAQRRHRRMAWIATAATAGMLFAGGLSFYALQQRAQAERERAEAEGLIEFMIGDLRKKLEPVGRLEIMDSVGNRALGYYAKQDLADLDADALGRRARSLHLIGEMRELRGQLEGAEKVFEQASRSTGQLLARDPDNSQRIFDHAQSVFWVGYIAWQRGEWPTAERFFKQYLEQAQRLVAIDPNKREWQMELIWATRNLGTVYFNQGRYVEAEKQFQASLDQLAPLVRSAPEDADLQQDHAQALAWLADAKLAVGDFARVESLRRRELDIYRKALLLDPKNQRLLEFVVVNLNVLGKVALIRGDTNGSLALYRQGLQDSEALLRADESNAAWKQFDVALRIGLATGLLWLDDSGAEAVLMDAERRIRDLLATDSGVLKQRLYLMEILQLRSLLNARRGDVTGAIAELARQERELMGMSAEEKQDRHVLQLLTDSLARKAALAISIGDEGTAKQAARRLLEELPSDRQAPRDRLLRQFAQAVGEGRKSRALHTIETRGYHHPEVEFYRSVFR